MTVAARTLALQGRSIMVVEDEFFQAKDLARALTDEGASLVRPFSSVNAALEAMDDGGAFDAAVLDINLRGRAVYEVADRLAERGIPFLFATGYDPEMVPATHRARPVCTKPFRIESLMTAVAQLCAPPSAGPGQQQPHDLR